MVSFMENDRFKFKKKYGQNFLKDQNIIKRIVESAEIAENSLVLEVGPGMGVLTKCLAENAMKVLCYEVDLQLQEYLENNLSEYDNVVIHFKDFLKADIERDLSEFSYNKLYFISNIPYYITTPILMKLMDLPFEFSNIVVMIQKEVANRFSSLPGCRDYGSITVFLNYFYEVEKLFDVGREKFMPSPHVDSAVISLKPRANRLEVYNMKVFFQLIHDSFQFKRKNLRNNLKSYDLVEVEKVLNEYGFDLNVRAENLGVDVFVAMSNALSK